MDYTHNQGQKLLQNIDENLNKVSETLSFFWKYY